MAAQAKFLFDVDFSDGPGKKEAEPTITASAHQAAIAEAEARGYRNGVAAAEAQLRTEAERRTASALERIAAAMGSLATSLKAVEDRFEAESFEVAVAVARKLAPQLLAREPLAEIAALAKNCFNELLKAPHVVVRVNEQLYATARENLEEIARTSGFEGRLVVLGVPDIQIGDCRIEWADGGLTRDRTATEAAIVEAVDRYVAVRRGVAPQSLERATRPDT
jgi:flagellar assembly protein FliH